MPKKLTKLIINVFLKKETSTNILSNNTTIAINCFSWQNHQTQEQGIFVQQMVLQLLQQHQNQQFILIFGEEIPSNLPNNANIVALKSGKLPKYGLQFFWWYNVKFPSLIKKYKVSVVLQPFGFCSLVGKTPQVLVVQNLTFLQFSKNTSQSFSWFFKAFAANSIKKANKVLTPTNSLKQSIIKHFKILPQNISVIQGATLTNFVPIGFNEQQAIKEKFTQGHNYFFVVDDSQSKNVTIVLKAFSIFKKWQLSNFKLVIVNGKKLKNIDTYKYKNDVVLVDNLQQDEFALVTASAYATIHSSSLDGFATSIVESMQTGIPAICRNTNTNKEIAGEAALFFSLNNEKNLAEQMIELYKNEDLRSSLIQKGIQQAQQFNWEKTANLFWDQLLPFL